MLGDVSTWPHSSISQQRATSGDQQLSYNQAYYYQPAMSNPTPSTGRPTSDSQDLSPVAAPTYVPLTVRITMLNLRFMQILQTKAKSQAQDLQSFYCLKSADIESTRLTALRSTKTNIHVTKSIDAYYDQRHNSLIDQLETNLASLEAHPTQATHRSVPAQCTKTTVSKTKSIGSVALRIMTSWYERNSEHPYPSYDTCEVMAQAGNITVDQVKKWFANRRLRLCQTKPIQVIAKRRKRSRSVSQDDIFFAGGSSSE